MEINQGKVYHSKLKNADHTYGAVYDGKIEFTIVNFLQCDLNHYHNIISSILYFKIFKTTATNQ